MFKPYKALLGMIAGAAFLAIPAAAASSAVPGTLNYVEGQVSVAGRTVTSRSVGSVQLEPNQVLDTGQGRAEILLTPGVFLRVGDNAAVRLISPGLVDTRVEVLRGQAFVEVTEVFKDNNLWILMNGASTRLAKEGLYSFNADSRMIQVFDGQAMVQQNDRTMELKKGRELALGGPWKAAHFDAKSQAAQGPLYAWSNLRSEYEAEASMQSARTVFVRRRPRLVWTRLVLESLLGHVRLHSRRWHLVQSFWLAVLFAVGGVWVRRIWVWVWFPGLRPWSGVRTRTWACER